MDYLLWGATGQAKVLRECVGDAASLVAVFDNDPSTSPPFDDVPLYHGWSEFERWNEAHDSHGFLVAVAGNRGADRLSILASLRRAGHTPLTAVHRTAFVAASVAVGAGSQILAQAAVAVDVVLGEACIINTGAIVDHESRLGDGVHIAPGARLAGCVTVGAGAMVGTGAVVLPRVRVGESAVVAAGAVVVEDVPPRVVVRGVPARLSLPGNPT